ncbi:MAG TPA: sugar phosphate isomerase/epimerase family protein [Chthonomonadaceae bacterium]|nr:sugar phosphate isomerase/epimerase family protein [Chthonomonadaceae bacterium]
MRLAIITDEISQEFEHALDVMDEYGVKGAELRGLWGTNIADLSDEQAARAQQALSDRQMQVVGLATPFYKCPLEAGAVNPGEAAGDMHLAKPRGLEEQMEILRRCIALAHRLDTKLLRVFAFWRQGELTPEIAARIAAAFAEPVALAAREGVTLVLENEPSCCVGTGREAAEIAQRIDSPHFRICWDPGNAFYAGERPYPEGYAAVAPWLGHVHLKDVQRVDTPSKGLEPQCCLFGTGEIDYHGQLAALKRDGYAGFLSLEPQYVPETDGGTPEEGSRQCLAAVQRFLAD